MPRRSIRQSTVRVRQRVPSRQPYDATLHKQTAGAGPKGAAPNLIRWAFSQPAVTRKQRARTNVPAGNRLRGRIPIQCLIRRSDHRVGWQREMLARDVWREPRRATPIDNVIDVQMARLRRKVDADARQRLLHTVRGVGFVLREGES